ncbi:hypothetical protein SDC9_111551 [bioreactor metagenome]|uniref:Uncharacterized protein n=1 Tax=bioreactor metagenome TaxID=1076179 RepID=A0A645BN07_9ZZZZ
MLFQIESCYLLCMRYTKPYGLLQKQKQTDHGHRYPQHDRSDSQCLNTEHCKPSAVEQTSIYSEYSNKKRSERPADSMHRNGTDRIIDVSNLFKEFNGEYNDYAADDPNDGRAERRDCITACGYCNQAGECSVEGHRYIGFLIPPPRQEHGCNGCKGCGQIGIEENHCRTDLAFTAIETERRTTIETEPTEPEDEHTQGSQGEAVTRNRLCFLIAVVLTNSRSDDLRPPEGCNSSYHMNCSRTGKVMKPKR